MLGAQALPHSRELMRGEPKTFDNEILRSAIDSCRDE